VDGKHIAGSEFHQISYIHFERGVAGSAAAEVAAVEVDVAVSGDPLKADGDAFVSVALIDGNYSPLLNYKEDFAAECYALMQMQVYHPKTIVEYNRKAFIAKENKIRITFDHQIVSTESDMNLFAKDLNMNPVLDPFSVVLEVKFNGFLPDYIKDLLSNAQKSELSVSKYMLARRASYKYNA
jgi:hypothetical protein